MTMNIENEIQRIRFDMSKMQRVLDQTIRVGIVRDVDVKKGTASVIIKEGEFWQDLQIVTQRAGKNGFLWWMPSEGEMVIILMPWGGNLPNL